MNELNQLKAMIDTLQRRRLGVGKQIAEFQVLQAEIAALYARADSCPDAIQKLKQLNGVLGASNGISHRQKPNRHIMLPS